ncbi:hypothetical protein ACTXT7_005240 [Hymenolepis weldensis]
MILMEYEYNYSLRTVFSLEPFFSKTTPAATLLGYDVFNALDLLENAKFFEDLKFGIGDGNLHYYLYNWRCPTFEPEEVGIVCYKAKEILEYLRRDIERGLALGS